MAKGKKKYEVVYLVNENYGKLPTFDTKEEGYAFINGLTWHCKISPDEHPCESCNAEFEVFEVEPLERISEETRPTGKNDVVEPLQNGERERVEQILDYYITKSDCYTYDSIVSQKRRKMLKSEIEDLLSQSKKECEEELAASKLLWERMDEWQKEWRAENPKKRELVVCDGLKLIEWKVAQSKKEELEYLIEEYGEVDTPYLSMLPHEIPEERERLERLTNQKKYI